MYWNRCFYPRCVCTKITKYGNNDVGLEAEFRLNSDVVLFIRPQEAPYTEIWSIFCGGGSFRRSDGGAKKTDQSKEMN